MSKKNLGDFLVQSGIISDGELRVAASEKSRWGDDLARALLELNLVTEPELMPLLGEFINVATVSLAERELKESTVRLLEEEFCRRNECIAFEFSADGRFLLVAMAAPNNLELFDEIRVKTQCNIHPILAGPADIQQALTRTLRGDRELSTELQFALMGESLLDLAVEDEEPTPPESAQPAAQPEDAATTMLGSAEGTPGPARLVRPTEPLATLRPPSASPAAPSDDVGQLRQELQEFMRRTDQFLHALAWHLARSLPLGLVAGELVPYPGGSSPGGDSVASAAAPSVPSPPAPSVPPPAPSVHPPPPAQELEVVTIDAERPPGRKPAPVGNDIVVDRPPRNTEDHDPQQDDMVVDRPPQDDDVMVDRPPQELRQQPSRVVASSGADSAAASGEICKPPPADPSASSAVLLTMPDKTADSVVAMDFGTTRSSVAMLVDNQVAVLRLPQVAVLRLPGGQWDMPSVVGFRHDGSVVLGQAARKMLATDPTSAVMSPKRLLGRAFDDSTIQPLLANMAITTLAGPGGEVMLRARGREITIIETCAHILNLLRLVAERGFGREVTEVVLSVPVSYGDPQRTALERAAKIANLDVVGLIDEPVAAALSNRYDERFRGKVGVYDFGGGTFDFTVVEVDKGRGDLRVLAQGGDAWLGGDDIDEVLANAAANAFWRETGVELRNQVTQWQPLLVAAEAAKRELSLRNETVIHLPDAARTAKGPYDLRFKLSRALFATLCQPIIKRSLETCQETLDQARLRVSDLDALFVSGGTSYIPAVQHALGEYFGRVPRSAVPPERAVIVGAALHQAFLGRPQRQHSATRTPS